MKIMKRLFRIFYVILRKAGKILAALFTFKFDVLKTEIVRPVKNLSLRIRNGRTVKAIFDQISAEASGCDVVIFPPTLDWNMELFQRPQQLAAAYARKKDTLVIYLTANLQQDRVEIAENPRDGLWIVYGGFSDRLPKALSGARRTIMSLSWTLNKTFIDIIKPTHLIYEYIDELEIFDKYDSQMVKDHDILMRRANLTICTATKLYNKALGVAAKPMLSPNAGDYDFFSNTDSYEISPLIADRISRYNCVLGYYGALAQWFDYELVKNVAQSHPDWVWVLVGMDYDGSIGKSGIEDYDNIIHIPSQPYVDLPKFLKAFDIATIPFVINEITLSTSPVKLFEYMAAGKPIITSAMPECLKYKSVMTYESVAGFDALVERALSLRPDDLYWKALETDALDNTWDARTDDILSALE